MRVAGCITMTTVSSSRRVQHIKDAEAIDSKFSAIAKCTLPRYAYRLKA